MSIKTKLGMGIAGAVLSVGLIGGGTFAYFSDEETTDNSFAAGTLDLSVDPTAIIEVDNLKPGDWMNREFKLINDGSLDISEVLINTDYTVDDAEGNNNEDMGEHIRVNFLKNGDKSGILNPNNIITSATLAELKGEMPDAVKNDLRPYYNIIGQKSGLKAGDSDKLYVEFEFVDNDEDQNEFQGDTLNLEWTFEAKQGEGESR